MKSIRCSRSNNYSFFILIILSSCSKTQLFCRTVFCNNYRRIPNIVLFAAFFFLLCPNIKTRYQSPFVIQLKNSVQIMKIPHLFLHIWLIISYKRTAIQRYFIIGFIRQLMPKSNGRIAIYSLNSLPTVQNQTAQKPFSIVCGVRNFGSRFIIGRIFCKHTSGKCKTIFTYSTFKTYVRRQNPSIYPKIFTF